MGERALMTQDEEQIDLVHLKPRRVLVDNLYLDPNNPRLAVVGESLVIADSQITDEALQAELSNNLKNVGIQDIVDKIKKLGFLPIDRIVVRPIKGDADKFVVLEGNRRLAAIRAIRANAALRASLTADVRGTLDELDVLVYEGADTDIAWIIQGFRHIESIKDWGPFQKARYLVDLHERRELTVSEVAATAGLGRTTVARLIRSYYGWQQARENVDYGDQIREENFAIFQEAIFHQNDSPLWTWLGWKEADHRFSNEGKLGTMIGLLKDKGENGAPRIPRVNPDLRDKFARLTLEGNEHALRSFLDGELELDAAFNLVQRVETEGETVDQLVNVDAQARGLREIDQRLTTLPTPKIVDEGKTEEFAGLLDQIAHTAAQQASLIRKAGEA